MTAVELTTVPIVLCMLDGFKGWRHASMLWGTDFGFVAGWMSAWAGAARSIDGKWLLSGGNGAERAL